MLKAAFPQNVELSPEEIAAALGTPPDSTMGDLAFGCFSLAKSLRQAPPRIAADLAARVSTEGLVESVTAAECVSCFAADELARIAYGSSGNCAGANVTPSTPASIPGDEYNDPIAEETVRRARALSSFAPIDRLARAYPQTHFALLRACARLRRKDWLRGLVEISREAVS